MFVNNGSNTFYQCRYFDPFSGAGKYSPDHEEGNMEYKDSREFGTPIVAIDALHAQVKNIEKYSSSDRPDNFYKTRLKMIDVINARRSNEGVVDVEEGVVLTCHFILNDVKVGHLKSLKGLVDEKFCSLGWKRREEEEGQLSKNEKGVETKYYEYHSKERGLIFRAKVDFHRKAFKNFTAAELGGEVSHDLTALFSTVDPFGSGIPFSVMQELVGENKFLFVIFMVQTINRFRKMRGDVFDEVYGHSKWKDIYKSAGKKPKGTQAATDWTNANLEGLVESYQEITLKEMCDVKSVRFAFRKGKTAPDKATLFYTVFAANTLTAMQSMKFGFQRHLQAMAIEMKDLAFTDYYFYAGIDVELGRKADNNDEAQVVYDRFKGQQATLGQVRAFVLLSTPFPYHVGALRVLEQDGRIVSVDDRKSQQKRQRKSFFAKPIPREDFTDQCGNLWLIRFASEEEWALYKEENTRKTRKRKQEKMDSPRKSPFKIKTEPQTGDSTITKRPSFSPSTAKSQPCVQNLSFKQAMKGDSDDVSLEPKIEPNSSHD